MFKDIKSLGKETFIYGFSTVVARLLNFILLPFYTYYLATGEYGIVASVFAYIAFMNIIYQHGMDQAYMRYASDPKSATPKENFSTPFWSILVTALALSVILHFGASFFAGISGIGAEYYRLIRYSAWILALDAISVIPFAELRLKHRPWTFAGIKTFNIVVNIVLNIILVGWAGMGIEGVFIASLTAALVSVVLLFPVFLGLLRPVFKAGLFADMLRFGAPLVPAGVGAMMVQVIDRPILLKMTDEATVGIYQANYKLGIFMMLLVIMFDQAWRPFFLERAGRPDSTPLYGRIFTYCMLSGIWAVMALSFFMPDLARVSIFGRPLIHQAYWSGLGVVPVVITAYLFYGAYINFMASIILSKRTDLLIWVTFLGAAVNVAANFILIPCFGMMGAAWATLLAYFVMALALFLLGRMVYPIPYEYGRLAHLILAAALVLAAAYFARQLAPGAMAWTVVRAGVLIAFPLFLVLTGFFKSEEVEAFKKAMAICRKE